MKKYLAVYEKIRSDIVAGAIPYKSKLPSKRAIAAMTNVSLVTVEHAYEILQSEGYVESRERSGYYVEYTADASFYTAEPESVRTVPPSRPTATDEQFPFSVYAAAVRSVVSERGESLLKKSPNTVGMQNGNCELSAPKPQHPRGDRADHPRLGRRIPVRHGD